MFWWVWLIIGICFIVAIIMSGWNLFSVVKFNFPKKNNWTDYFSKLPNIQFLQKVKISNNPGILCIVFGNKWHDNDKFLPFLVMGSENIAQSINNFKKQMQQEFNNNNTDLEVIKYLKETNQDLTKVTFYVVSELKNFETVTKKTKKFLKKSGFSNSSFNKK